MAQDVNIKMKREPTVWENIFANETLDQGLISKIYKGIYIHSRREEVLPFAAVWMEMESIMLCERSQAVKDKYHMTSPVRGI